MTKRIDRMLTVGAVATAIVLGVGMARAETDTVNMAQQFGLLYVPLHVVMEKQLIQKQAAKLGLPAPEIKLYKISGGANINKALLAKTLDFGAHGVGPSLKLWGKTKGRFKVAVNMAYMPLKLITNDSRISKVEDYLKVDDHKIATPAAKVSIQAVTLQMHAANLWNEPEKLDHMVVSMKHPISLAAIMSGGQSVKSHFATLPYSYQELQSGKGKVVITSYDILGGEHSTLNMSARASFKKENPKTYQAVVNAYYEAYDWIKANPTEAAKIFIKYTKSKMNPQTVEALLGDPKELTFSSQPKHTIKYANFLNKIGDIPLANNWKEYHFDNNHGFQGS